MLDAAGDKPVIFRTVDIGGDKSLPYLHATENGEENPAMGWRALRLALDRDGLMKAQARALLEAAAGRDLNVMFPMVSEPWEFDAAKTLFEEQRAWLAGRKKMLPNNIRYGAMLEVPALAEMLDVLLPRLDFMSIGTNDLTQFLFAADRANPTLAERYDWLSPGDPALPSAGRARGRRRQCADRRLRRDGRPHARGDGADRPRHPPPVDHAGRGRPDQGDDSLARPRRCGRRARPVARYAAARHARRACRLGEEE